MTKIHTPVHQSGVNDLIVTYHHHADYEQTHHAMLTRTLARIAQKKQGNRTPDELWLVEHQDVYTLGQAGKREHLLKINETNTPVIQTDRGGQVTWHGQGQLVAYWLFDIAELGWGVRNLVSHAEQSIEDILSAELAIGLTAHARQDAPGVYVYDGQFDAEQPTHNLQGKIASLGFKIKQGFSYHGLALNIRCDLSAFAAINPCGYAGMTMLNVRDVSRSSQRFNDDIALFELPIVTALIENIQKRRAGEIQLRELNMMTGQKNDR